MLGTWLAANFMSQFKSAEDKRYLINAAYSPSNDGYEWYMDALRIHLRVRARGTCDSRLFQSLHFSCRHALAACAAASVEWGSYVHPVHLQEYVFKVYEVEFPPIPYKKLWPEWHETHFRPNSAMRRKATCRPVSTRFHRDMDVVECQEKRCWLCRQIGHTKRDCLNQPTEDT
ncbi:hypothetical protein Ahy_A02g007136 [Arachis hypogaea]|uniref:CCHC-type domain-containing protein n=1 Tax=Arachis hypogaea TaxID=3818 RepID=A0A445EC68_ARAHY|nr:hypothetical protein Ahy_A02g007136 [Arachis hypogaea]